MISDPDVVGLLYLVSIVCFILALKFLSSPKHARRGNWVGGVGMVIAIATTLALDGISNWLLIVVGGLIGSVIGIVGARTVKMTAMPQMVALFNGVGGGAAALISLADFHERAPLPGRLSLSTSIAIVLSALIGSISFMDVYRSPCPRSRFPDGVQDRPRPAPFPAGQARRLRA